METKSGLKASEIVEMMERGAVFKGKFQSTPRTYSIKNGGPADDGHDTIYSCEYKNMTLKTPPPEPEYSLEFVEMGTVKMMELMISGLTLEMDNNNPVKLNVTDTNGNPFVIKVAGDWLSFGGWDGACRVYQEPKEETRWLWEHDYEHYTTITKEKHTEEAISAKFNIDKWSKVSGSEEQFPLTCQCNGKCPKCCQDKD